LKLTEKRLKQLDNPALTFEQRALLRCRIAAELIHTGQYEVAREALGNLWQGIGNRPDLTGLSILTSAEVLLQCGVLSGWLGSTKQISDAQEKAKDLLTEAQRKFQSQGQYAKASESQYELGLCYLRAGSYDDARVVLDEASKPLKEQDAELKAKIIIRRATVEIWTGRYYEARQVLGEAKTFFDNANDALKGRWYGQRGLVFRRLAAAVGNTEYYDKAIIEYTAALVHYEQARHERYCAINLNNLAFLLYKIGHYDKAHEHLNRATKVLVRLNDEGLLAQVNETRSRVLIAEHRYQEANHLIAGVIQTLERGGEAGLLADALAIRGVAWSRLGVYESSINIIRRAVSVGQDSGASSHAGLAALTLIEEHGATRLSLSELYETYRRADELLKNTQDAEDIIRLRSCVPIVVKRLYGVKLSDKNFSLSQAILSYEAQFIEQALETEHGSVTRAAKRLGLKHQTLAHILRKRHRELLNKRTPAVSRRRSIINDVSGLIRQASGVEARPITILHVEDNKIVADIVKASLESEGWKVETCIDGAAALTMLLSDTPYNLMLFDNELPNINGIELVRLTRKLPYRRSTSIVMLSASDCETEAWKAGVDAFLRKPKDVATITTTIARLLAGKLKR
jgi:CheY-like chemotaxis protein/Tfp pilus assembly protein PilF